jgi:hypothetical protein
MINIIVNGIYDNIYEYVEGIKQCFIDNNIPFRFYHNELIFSDVNIVFSGKAVKVDPDRYNILFETQNNNCRHYNNPISDYSQFNKIVQMFKENESENSIYFPLCYSKYFRGIKPKKLLEDIDIMYFGSMVDYRPEFVQKFNIPCFIKYGKERDELIYRTKINLLIDRWKGNYRFSPLHAFLSWCKGKIVLVQKCPHYEVYQNYIIEFTEDNFLDVYNYWLERDKMRNDFGKYIQQDLKTKLNLKDCWTQLMKDILP